MEFLGRYHRGLFNIYKNSENNWPYLSSDSICTYVHFQEQPVKMAVIVGYFRHLPAFK